MGRKIVQVIVGIVLLLCFPGLSGAQMLIDNAIVYFGKEYPDRRDIEVANTGKSPLYLRVTPYEITHPGTPEEKKVKASDPRQTGLLVTPAKLVVAPGGRKRIRFVNLDKNRSAERVFRVLLQPVAGKVKSTQTGLKLLIGYEVLVLAQPADIRPDLQAHRNGRELVLDNQGNVDIYLRDVRQCPPSEKDRSRCQMLRDKRLYPGNSWSLKLPRNWPVHLESVIGLKRIPRIF